MCVLVGLSVGLVCVHARPLLVSPVHAAKLFNVIGKLSWVAGFCIENIPIHELEAE